MKKLFYSMFALSALAMTSTSCSDELENGGINANEAAVTFTVQLENNVGSRAIGDGTTAKNLYFAVYKAETGKIGDEVEALRQRVDVQPDLTATINTRLVKGQTYNFVFWAQTEEMTVEQSLAGDGTYYNLADMSSIKLTYATPANNEQCDAFYARRNDLKITGPINETIILKRPFAQVNVGTLIGSLAEAATAEVKIAKSKITFSEVATEFHPYDGTVGEESTDKEIIFDAYAIPESNVTDTEGDLKNVADKNYEYLSMNYILVADRATDGTNPENGERKAIIPNATFEIFDEAGTSINTFEIPNLPVQRNWRTNIIGDILSSNVTFNIIIDPDFDDDHNYFTNEELAYVLKNGGEYTLEEDLAIEKSMVIESGATVVLNLNGHNIVNNSATGNFGEDEAIIVKGKLTIEGEGTVQSKSMAVWARGDEGAVINIYGGTYKGLDTDLAKGGRGVIYASGGNTINIYGGKFEALAADKTSFANKTDGVYASLNIYDNDGTINVYGGSFYKFNPAEPGTEPASWNDSHPNGFVADGYEETNVGDYYYVTKEDVTAAANATDLASALATAGEVAMVEDVTIASTVTIADGATLDGQGNTVTMTKNNTQTALAPSKGGIIKNINIEGYNERNEAGKVIRGILETDIAGDLVLDNVNISGVAYPINIQATSTFVPAHSLTATGSTFTGWTSYTGLTSASFTDCIFAVGNYFDATVAGQETWNGCIKPYVTSTFTGCEFGEGFVLDLSALKADATLTFENCTVNGVALTALSQLGVTGSDTRVTIM